MQHFENHDPRESACTQPVDRVRQRHNATFGQQQIQRSEPREDMLDAQGADERRQDQRRQQRRPEQPASRETVTREDDRERNGNQRGEACRQQRDFKTVHQRHPVKPVLHQKTKKKLSVKVFVSPLVGQQKRPAQ